MKLTTSDIIKKALKHRIGKVFYAHEMSKLADWAKDYYGYNHNVATYDRKFRELRSKGEIVTKTFKNKNENGYHIIEVR